MLVNEICRISNRFEYLLLEYVGERGGDGDNV